MAASVSGSKTAVNAVSPVHSVARINSILATPVENLQIKDITFLEECFANKANGRDPNVVIGSLFQ